jgi:hypothetical protein
MCRFRLRKISRLDTSPFLYLKTSLTAARRWSAHRTLAKAAAPRDVFENHRSTIFDPQGKTTALDPIRPIFAQRQRHCMSGAKKYFMQD